MEMGGHDHVTQKKQAFVLHTILQTFYDNIEILFFFEYAKPFGDGAGGEVD
jgi:hypothetical protein